MEEGVVAADVCVMKKAAKEYLREQLWIRTVDGALGRTRIYSSKDAKREHQEYRTELRAFLEDLLSTQYALRSVTEDEHLKNIDRIQRFRGKKKGVLKGNKIPFGVAQKILNLFLKYRWVIGDIKAPTHFPVDRQIQEILDYQPLVNWTGRNNEEMTRAKYMKIIEHARKCSDGQSLAEYELEEYNRAVRKQQP